MPPRLFSPPRTQVHPHKTHIICTLGPSARSPEQIAELLQNGMNVARFNFSHGSHEYHKETLDNLRTACSMTGRICAVLLDTKGPEIRTGLLKDGKPVLLQQVGGGEGLRTSLRMQACMHALGPNDFYYVYIIYVLLRERVWARLATPSSSPPPSLFPPIVPHPGLGGDADDRLLGSG